MSDVSILNPSSDLSAKTLMAVENAETVTGLKTFDRDPSAPFAVTAGSAVVTNLDADKLDGEEGSAYHNAANLTGTIASSVQDNITRLGTIASGVWSGTTVGVTKGGTGATSLTDHGVLVGSGTSAVDALAAGTTNQYLRGVSSADPAFTDLVRLQSTASAATVTPNADTNDMVVVTAQAEALTLANPSGTPFQGQKLVIRLKDNGTARAISYGTQYRSIGNTLPTTTAVSKTVYLGLVYNSTDTKWDLIALAQET